MLTFGLWLLTTVLILPTGGAQDRVCPLFTSEHERFGVNTTPKYGQEITAYDTAYLNFGWFLDYTYRPDAPQLPGHSYLPLISARGFNLQRANLDLARIEATAQARPGALWILGNEPDRIDLQDSQRPEDFAIFYHTAYTAIKRIDPSARIAIGGLVQPTPIRLVYLDRVLAEYQRRYGTRLPVDVWTVHNFIIREELNNWGADIPPGLEDLAELGIKYSLSDHGNLDHFRNQLIAFRQWMAERGYRNKPLLLTEYGILMPPQYGYPSAVVEAFMRETFDFLRTAQDPATGYPADNNRLVQAWSWYSLNDYAYSFDTGIGANGNLFDHDSAQLQPVGQAFADYTAPLVDRHHNLAVVGLQAPSVLPADTTTSIPVHVWITNAGNLSAENIQVALTQTQPDGTEHVIGHQTVGSIDTHCQQSIRLTFEWTAGTLQTGNAVLTAHVNAQGDRITEHNTHSLSVRILPAGAQIFTLALPAVEHAWPQ